MLHAIESFYGKASSDAAKEVAIALKHLYDADVLEEEVVIEWYYLAGKFGGLQDSFMVWWVAVSECCYLLCNFVLQTKSLIWWCFDIIVRKNHLA